jgi:CheY-like chemotaxis protein
VLVVDDEPWIAEVLARMLEDEGHEVETAPNGSLALAKILENNYDLVVCDVHMPELNGLGLYDEVKRLRPDLLPRIVFMTGSALSPAMEGYLARTGAPCLSKPFREEDVQQHTRDILAGRGEAEGEPSEHGNAVETSVHVLTADLPQASRANMEMPWKRPYTS